MEHLDHGLAKLLSGLEESRTSLPNCTEEEYGFLTELLKAKEFNSLVCVYQKILQRQKDDKFSPVLSNAMEINVEVLGLLSTKTHGSDDTKELFQLLQKPHIQAILITHDTVAQKDYYPKLPEIPVEVDEDEETVKIVQLVKSDEPLSGTGIEPIMGATIKTDEATGKIVIARVMHGGAADRSGLIHVADEILEVNGTSVEGKTPNDVLKILQNSEGTITFKIVPADSKRIFRESKVRVRAHFDYKAKGDTEIPCTEAGLDFNKGDILHIVCQDDKHWWQARKEGDRNMRAGLIPSRALQEHRIITLRQKKHDKSDDLTIKNDDFDREEIPTYEEVTRLYPRPGFYRPVVLIGPPGVGRNELKRRLLATDAGKYKTPVPYTSRPPRPGEVDGKEYNFVSREQMQADIDSGKFIEHGEYKGNLYGTCADSVATLVDAGYVVVLSPHYQALKMLRTAQLKPYIIYIKPPSFDVFKETRNTSRARSTFDEANSRGFTDEEFNEILASASRIEFHYAHMFDETIVNADLPIAFEQLVNSIGRLESEPMWVPASWV